MKTLTTNQHYGGLNRRFDKRAALLRRFGFKYRSVAPGIAVFTRHTFTKEQNISASAVLHADRVSWVDTLRTVLRW